jgi:hypothetical protein
MGEFDPARAHERRQQRTHLRLRELGKHRGSGHRHRPDRLPIDAQGQLEHIGQALQGRQRPVFSEHHLPGHPRMGTGLACEQHRYGQFGPVLVISRHPACAGVVACQLPVMMRKAHRRQITGQGERRQCRNVKQKIFQYTSHAHFLGGVVHLADTDAALLSIIGKITAS